MWGANHGERGVRACNEGLEAEPPVESKGRKLLVFGRSMEVGNFATFLKSRNTENQTFVMSHQCGHRTIVPLQPKSWMQTVLAQVELCGPVPHSVVPPVTVAEQRSHG